MEALAERIIRGERLDRRDDLSMLVELNLERYGLTGVWRVLSTGHGGDGKGLHTVLELGEREITV